MGQELGTARVAVMQARRDRQADGGKSTRAANTVRKRSGLISLERNQRNPCLLKVVGCRSPS